MDWWIFKFCKKSVKISMGLSSKIWSKNGPQRQDANTHVAKNRVVFASACHLFQLCPVILIHCVIDVYIFFLVKLNMQANAYCKETVHPKIAILSLFTCHPKLVWLVWLLWNKNRYFELFLSINGVPNNIQPYWLKLYGQKHQQNDDFWENFPFKYWKVKYGKLHYSVRSFNSLDMETIPT